MGDLQIGLGKEWYPDGIGKRIFSANTKITLALYQTIFMIDKS